MLRNASTLTKNVVIGIFMIVSNFIQISYLQIPDGFYTVVVSVGIATGFLMSFGKKMLPGIIIGTFIGVFFWDLIITQRGATTAFLYTLPMIFLTVTTALMVDYGRTVTGVTYPKDVNSSLKYVGVLVLVSLIASILPAIQYSLDNGTNAIDELLNIARPTFTGLGIFGTLILFSNTFDKPLHSSHITDYKDLLYVTSYSVITFGVFSGYVEGVDYSLYGPVFIILFLICSLVFNYRMLVFSSIMYITIYNVVYFRILNLSRSTISSGSLNLYLMILLSISIFIKELIRKLNYNNSELEKSSHRYQNMLDSTISLIKTGGTLNYSDESYKKDYVKTIFQIATQIFERMDNAICAMQTEGEIDVIATKGYDIDFVRSWKVQSRLIRWNRYKPAYYKDGVKYYEKLIADRIDLFENSLPKVRETIRFTIKLGDDEHAGISFDILESSKDTFTKKDYENIEAFQEFINSFYESNELAIKNNNLKDDIVLSLIRTLELYDQYTGGHSEDVATLSKMVAESMGLSPNEIYNIYWAGIVHDIGKIGISSEIINKPGKLTLEEYKKVQEHPIFGHDILIQSEDLKQIAILVKHHHEWWNGGGYPNQIEGEEIPLGSQILQVADSVSSMATKRSYSPGKSLTDILEELKMYKGTQFSPEVTEHMCKLIESGKIEDYYKDHKWKSKRI